VLEYLLKPGLANQHSNLILNKRIASLRNLTMQRIARRTFLKTATILSAATLSRGRLTRAQAANDRLNIVIIGCGGRGGSNMRDVSSQNIVALCDVNENNLLKAAQQFPKAKQFTDFRELYHQMSDNEFDAVVVSTCEHTHAFATLPALRRKKHVYCEKPLTHNIREARIVTAAAKEAGVATQMGTQIHASNNYRRVVELIQSGAIGPVRECHVWVDRAWGLQSESDAKTRDRVVTMERPTTESPVPTGLHWDLWLGPAPYRPFHEVYFPGPNWYRWWEWGSGTMSDLGSHWNDLPFWALKLDAPLAVEAKGPPPHPDLAPASMSATYEYGPRGDMPAVKLTWYQGTMKPPAWQEGKIPQSWRNGALFIGDKGMLLADYGKYVLLPEKDFEKFELPPQTIPESLGHHAEWLHACKTGAPTTCHFGYSGPLTEANHLGNVAYRSGKRIEWDAKNMRIPNAPDAERFLSREYRKGWTLDSIT
jgi:predicted dehydrogenase